MYLSYFAYINQPKRFQNFHLGVGKYVTETDEWSHDGLESHLQLIRSLGNQLFKEQPSWSQIKEGKAEEKIQTNLSLHCLLTFLKKKKNLPNDIMAIYYVLSLFTDSPLVLQSFHLWLVCVSSMNRMTYLFKYDSFPLSQRYRIMIDSELWGLGWPVLFLLLL